MPDTNLADPSMLKFGVGQPVPRREDPTLLQGQGKYTDDISLPGRPGASWSAAPTPMA